MIGEVDGPSEILVEGRVGPIEVHLIVTNPNSVERYRLNVQRGWIHGVFDRFDFINVEIGGEWVGVEVGE